MTYVVGGVYFCKSTIRAIAVTICSSPYSIPSLSTAIKFSATWVAVKLGSLLGSVGWFICGTLATYVVSQAVNIAERMVTALLHGKGCDFTIGWQWVIVPVIERSIRR